MKEVFDALIAHMNQGEECVLVSAVGGEGSAPRKTQSHMLVDAHGRVCGTVGGGAVEGKSIVFAVELLKKRESDIRVFELYEQAANDIGMICGGKVQVHFQFISPDDEVIFAAATAACSALSMGEDAWLIIDLTDHRLAINDGKSRYGADIPLDESDSKTSSFRRLLINQTSYYIEQLSYSDRVYIFGGGHVAQALVPVLSSVHFRCIVIEDRKEFCQKALFPYAQDVLLLDETQWASCLTIGQSDGICIMTRGHQNDLACQAFALRTQAGYIGVIGSRRKIASVNARLCAMGFDEEQIARIVTPIGLEIGAETPAEIAVSIAAQMIAWRAKRRNNQNQKSCMA